jgi:hypothetical protein
MLGLCDCDGDKVPLCVCDGEDVTLCVCDADNVVVIELVGAWDAVAVPVCESSGVWA